MIWIETISSYEELDAAVEAAATTGLPYASTLSFDTAGHTMMGIHPRAFGEWWLRNQDVAALGANCGVGPGDAVAAAYWVGEVAPDAVTITKANCGIPLYKAEGGLTYPLGPDDMAEYVDLALRSGARIIGACCGSTPDHIAAIREAVDAFQGGSRPGIEEVQTRLDASVPGPARAPRHQSSRCREDLERQWGPSRRGPTVADGGALQRSTARLRILRNVYPTTIRVSPIMKANAARA